jgi:hypothetical protein
MAFHILFLNLKLAGRQWVINRLTGLLLFFTDICLYRFEVLHSGQRGVFMFEAGFPGNCAV